MKRNFWQTIWFVLRLTCDESARLLSDSMDRDLTRTERTALRLHNLTCKSCKRFVRQLQFLREAAPKVAVEPGVSGIPDDAKERIRRALKDASSDER
ncbi:MAG TPA: zf-HC2 domain-containing protein [Fimbriimonadaceae bacterium]|nr:zf-HC2 domain-containing protein [Fimbriimonadaceae bacterium]